MTLLLFPTFGFVLVEQIDAHAFRDAPQNLILISGLNQLIQLRKPFADGVQLCLQRSGTLRAAVLTARPLCFASHLFPADHLTDGVRSLHAHAGRGVDVGAEREPRTVMSEHFGECPHVNAVFEC